MERRKRDRRDLELTCYVGVPSLGDEPLVGVSENISRSGMLLRLPGGSVPPEAIRVGRTATVEVELPVEHILEPRCLHGEGQVVRISNSDSSVQVAVRFRTLEFRSAGPNIRSHFVEPASRYIM